jgi:hypothetical protein
MSDTFSTGNGRPGTFSSQASPPQGGGALVTGSIPSEGGRFIAARLPKGWTGPVSKSGTPGFRKEARFFCARPNSFQRQPNQQAPCPEHILCRRHFITPFQSLRGANGKIGVARAGRSTYRIKGQVNRPVHGIETLTQHRVSRHGTGRCEDSHRRRPTRSSRGAFPVEDQSHAHSNSCGRLAGDDIAANGLLSQLQAIHVRLSLLPHLDGSPGSLAVSHSGRSALPVSRAVSDLPDPLTPIRERQGQAVDHHAVYVRGDGTAALPFHFYLVSIRFASSALFLESKSSSRLIFSNGLFIRQASSV